MSAESGLQTFRDAGGLWEGYSIEDVATPEGFERNPARVLDFYNEIRKRVRTAQPNPAHRALVELEAQFDVHIITQNVDDLHERAGSQQVIHLHGEISKARSIASADCLVPYEEDIKLGDLAPDGAQLRPHVVWFGEMVPKIYEAADIVETADIIIIVGTSLAVYPASSLVELAPPTAPIYVVDPHKPDFHMSSISEERITFLTSKASTGIPKLVLHLLTDHERLDI
ncbi:MAG: Sir2 family NAD-dependent protein deacetylase [Bacteroidota bacterium]